MRNALRANRQMIVAGGIIVLLLVGAAVFVASSLERSRPLEFRPSAISPQEASQALAGPHLYTIDATHEREWRYFDFSRGSRIDDPEPLGWDLGFRRNRIIVNGGEGFPGRAGVVDLGEVAFDRVDAAPPRGYQGTIAGRDSVQPALEEWYDYGFTSHVLEARPRVYAIRTADGRYSKLEVVSYYCPGARAGCVTFRYVYQGDGSTALHPSGSTAAAGR